MRIILSIVFTPLITTLLYVFMPLVFAGKTIVPNDTFLITTSYLITLFGLILIGLPICAFLKKFNIMNILYLSIFGGIGGVVYFSLFIYVLSLALGNGEFYGDNETMLWGFVLGLITTLIFAETSGMAREDKLKEKPKN